jgi:nitrogen-specific signal transduction histidine kinase/ActR/RegA family two-component response regulator
MANAERAEGCDERPLELVRGFSMTHAPNRVAASKVVQDRLEALGLLAGSVAHDFNNILTTIQLNAEAVLLRPELHEDDRPLLVQVNFAVRQAAKLTRQLLEFGRHESLDTSAVDASATPRDLEPMLRRLLPESIELTISAPDAPLPVLADSAQLTQTIVNLCVNARDAMPHGGRLLVRLGCAARPTPRLTGEPGPDGPVARFVIEDTGTGIPAEILPRIFDPYFTTKPAGKGSGLGLASVHGVVRQLGGVVWVASSARAGTTFVVELPLASSDVAREEPAAATRPIDGQLHVLLVEDDAAVRRVVRIALELHGVKVTEAAHGRDALQQLDEPGDRTQVVLSDTIMPTLGGLDLAEALRAEYPGLPIVLMTGYSHEELHCDLAALDLLDVQLLRKPFSTSTLIDAVRAAAERNRRA